MNIFDIDGVIYMGKDKKGIRPNPEDLIVTGRVIQEAKETLEMLRSRGIFNQVFFNPIAKITQTREISGRHKAMTLKYLKDSGFQIDLVFEDDLIQKKIIEGMHPELNIVHLNHEVI